MQILQVERPGDLTRIMRGIKVDRYGIKIMVPKAVTCLVRIDSLSNITANILKQEMLSLGGDAAVARDSLTGKTRRTDCLLIGSLAQFNRLKQKLKYQPFGLDKLAEELADTIAFYQKDNFRLELGRFRLSLQNQPRVMGILNLTPDSFSGDGMDPACYSPEEIFRRAEAMARDGADIIDIGGESSRPGARPVSLKEELRRTIPVIKLIARKLKVPVSVDTYKPEIARAAIDNGAVLINDITGLRDPRMVKVIAKSDAGVVVMHMQGNPRRMQDHPVYKNLIAEIFAYLKNSVSRAEDAGIKRERIIIDPGIGIGFGKTLAHNLEILKRLNEFKALGKPILVGPSRKAFIGKILKAGVSERLFGTVSACVMAVRNGAGIVRVHDVKEIKQALKICTNIAKA